jgi:hypothetical protein
MSARLFDIQSCGNCRAGCGRDVNPHLVVDHDDGRQAVLDRSAL